MTGLLRDVAIVAAAGAAGAVARYLLSGTVDRLARSGFPFGTLTVNVLGCLALGLLLELAAGTEWVSRDALLAGGAGFLGAFTTFSTFGVESVHLAEASGAPSLLANVFANVVAGLVAAWAGMLLARWWAT